MEDIRAQETQHLREKERTGPSALDIELNWLNFYYKAPSIGRLFRLLTSIGRGNTESYKDPERMKWMIGAAIALEPDFFMANYRDFVEAVHHMGVNRTLLEALRYSGEQELTKDVLDQMNRNHLGPTDRPLKQVPEELRTRARLLAKLPPLEDTVHNIKSRRVQHQNTVQYIEELWHVFLMTGDMDLLRLIAIIGTAKATSGFDEPVRRHAAELIMRERTVHGPVAMVYNEVVQRSQQQEKVAAAAEEVPQPIVSTA